jgi:hypothetical protein
MTHHAMARDNDWPGVAGHTLSNRPSSTRRSGLAGNLAVGASLTPRDGPCYGQHTALKGSADGRIQHLVEVDLLTIEVAAQLLH